MPYEPYRNRGNNGAPGNRNNGQQRNWDNRPNPQNNQAAPIAAQRLPTDYVDAAERVLNDPALRNQYGGFAVTTTKIRTIHAMVTDVYNKEHLRTEDTLLPESEFKLMRLRVRIAYDAGRERAVKTFVEKAHLLEYIKGIGNSRAEMIRFAHYMEALVAYHRYLGGRD